MRRYSNNFIVVVNSLDFLMSHRRELIETISRKFNLHVVYGEGNVSSFSDLNISFIKLSFLAGRVKISDVFGIIKTITYINSLEPKIIHSIALKANVLIGITSYFLDKNVKIVQSISGLGSFFISKGFINSFVKNYVLKVVFRKRFKYIFHNDADKKYFSKLYEIEQNNLYSTFGSGLDASWFKYSRAVTRVKQTKILLPTRLIRDKGVYEYLNAAKLLKEREELKFYISGSFDNKNKGAIGEDELIALCEDADVTYLGLINLKIEMDNYDIICLPSYREGLPRVLLEALARKRIVVTSNAPGCRDAVDFGRCGYLHEAESVSALCEAIEFVCENKAEAINKAVSGYRFVKSRAQVAEVVSLHEEIYEKVIK